MDLTKVLFLNKTSKSINFLFSSIPGSFVDEDENLGFLPSNWIIPKGGVIPKSLFGEKSYISYFGTAFLESEQYSTRLETVCVLKVLQKYDPNLLKPKPIEKNVSNFC